MSDGAIARPDTVLISGFGLGGAAFALALARQGIKTIILESRNEVSVQGRGRAINLSPNAIRVLDQIGVWNQLQHHGTLFDVMYGAGQAHIQTSLLKLIFNTNAVVRSDGGSLGGLRIGDEKKYGYRASGIWRADVHREMATALEQTGLATILYDSRVASVAEDAQSVTVTLTNGNTVSGDWLVGADGVRSSVRQHMFGDLHGITYDGMTAIDGIVDLSKVELEQHNIPPNAMIFGQEGAGGFFKVEDSATMWSIMVEIPERDRTGWKTFLESGEALETARKRIKGWGAPMETLLNMSSNEDCTLWPFYWVPPLDTWHAGRCVLMGDAAHAFPPFAGQGTAQALEDAMVLSRVFAESGTFSAYERERKKRAEGIRTMTKVASDWFRPTISWLRYQLKMYSLWFTIPYASWRGSEPIYRYDATVVPII